MILSRGPDLTGDWAAILYPSSFRTVVQPTQSRGFVTLQFIIWHPWAPLKEYWCEELPQLSCHDPHLGFLCVSLLLQTSFGGGWGGCHSFLLGIPCTHEHIPVVQSLHIISNPQLVLELPSVVWQGHKCFCNQDVCFILGLSPKHVGLKMQMCNPLVLELGR